MSGPRRVDVIVTGAGPAGAAAATALAGPTRSVLLVDDGTPARSYDAFLSAPTMEGLRRLAVDLPAQPVDGIDLVFGTRSRRLVPVRAAACDHAALARALRGAAGHAGADRVRATARLLGRDEGWFALALDGVPVLARHLVVATGTSGRPGHWMGTACVQRFAGIDLGTRTTLAVAQPDGTDPRQPPTCVWAVPAPGGGASVGVASVGVAGVGGASVGGAGVGAAGAGDRPVDPDALLALALAELRRIDARFTDLVPAGPVVSGPIDAGFVPERLTVDGLLIGAAAGLTNPFTGEGLSGALQSALLAAESITAHPDDPDAARRAYAQRVRTAFVGYFETARHASRRYHLTWRVLADAASSDQPFAAKARRAILFPEGIAGLGEQRVAIPDAPLVQPFLLACDEVAISVIRREWPFLARLASIEDTGDSQRPRPALLFLGALIADRSTLDVRHATTAAAIELATLGALAFLHPPPPRTGVRDVDWAAAATVLSGDFLLAQASRLIAESAPDASWMFADWLAELAGLRAAALDPDKPSQPELVYAALFEFPARIGAILGGAPARVVHALAEYGYHCGRAFLHAEDVLAVRGERTRLDTTLEAMLAGRFTGLPETLTDRLETADREAVRANLLSGAEAACGEARGRAVASLTAVVNPTAVRLLGQFIDAIAAPCSRDHPARGTADVAGDSATLAGPDPMHLGGQVGLYE
ncbi:hypothetical protein [Rugosimonospora africana]|uniref:Dehydrogenase (Flavoprotein) n=1 Tax=Rugosimonospora africana TaxID=556532 RepID=A0A8J3VSZ0_9ACTN|nr:hypothetical protein [Rugosimonospora africana]GIH17111.1 hypothetical protein Raf01_52830 [Rugosimonospora africana]